MSTADREYDIDAFLANLDWLNQQGTEATVPQLTGFVHPADGYPLVDIAKLREQVTAATPIPIDLGGGVVVTVQKLSGGGKVTFSYTF